MKLKLHSTALAIVYSAAVATPVLAFQAQPESNTQVGPPEIRDFSLPGTTPTPAPTPAPTPTEAQPEPVTIPAPPAPVAEQPAATETAPAPTEAVREQRGPARAPAPRPAAPAEVEEIAPDAPVQTPADAPPADAEPAPVQARPAPAAQPAEAGPSWLLPILAALAVLGGAIAVWRLRRRRADENFDTQPLVAPEAEAGPDPLFIPTPAPEPAVAAAPAAALAAPASDVPGIVLRPWLELVFKPARATATDGGASVQYEAVIRNTGNAPARNVRLAARMFNSGQDIQAEVSGFFAMGIDSPDGAPLTIPPRTEVALSSVVNMAREEMREIKVQGRSLFVPTVAFNLLYDWGRDKTGQTCSAHVVGREPDPPAEKMAPFRLDLGPRVYRSVGQRPSALARAV